MTIKTTAWHYRVYQYWARLSPTYKEGYRENLCHYVRVLLFWAPTTWLNQRSKAWRTQVALLAAFLYLGSVLTLGAVLLTIEYPAQIALAWSSLFTLIGALFVLFFVWKWSRGKQIIPQVVKDTSGLAWNYSKARKRRVCPFIEFDAA